MSLDSYCLDVVKSCNFIAAPQCGKLPQTSSLAIDHVRPGLTSQKGPLLLLLEYHVVNVKEHKGSKIAKEQYRRSRSM